MGEVLGFNVPIDIPSLNLGTGWLPIVATIFMFFLTGAIIIYVVYMLRLYNKKIIVLQNISGQGFQPVFKDRARLIKVGDGGEELLYLRKKKLYRTAYGRVVGKNTYWFAIGQDGYWYNIILGDVDAKKGMLDIEPVDSDVRMTHVSTRKILTEKYRKMGFMDKYGQVVITTIFLMIMMGGVWFLVDKMAEVSSALTQAVNSATAVQESTNKILSSLNNICGGSGIK